MKWWLSKVFVPHVKRRRGNTENHFILILDNFLSTSKVYCPSKLGASHISSSKCDFETSTKGGKKSQQGEVKVVEFRNAPITLRMISSLNSETWLNDEIMNCYFNLLQAREDRLYHNDKERGASHFF
jgi:hypothetical protein